MPGRSLAENSEHRVMQIKRLVLSIQLDTRYSLLSTRARDSLLGTATL